MKQLVKQSRKKLKINYFAIFILFVIFAIIINPTKYSNIALHGLEVWVKVLVPSLFPFFVLTKLFSASGFVFDFTKLFSKPMQKLYKCPPQSSYVFLMSIITGYPVGAKLVSDLYNAKKLSNADAIKTLSFCSNSGPMFILGSVAIGMFSNSLLGIIVYISHILGSLINGLIYRNYGNKNNLKNDINTPIYNANIKKDNLEKIDFSESINSSISSIMLIGGVICFTFVLIEVIKSSFLFNSLINLLSLGNINKNIISAIFSGFFEITNGCLMLSTIPLKFNTIAIFLTFIISFGGISTLLQALAFTKNIIPTKTFILQKITHAICASCVCFVLLLFI